MWEPRPLTTLWATLACYRNSFTFLPRHVRVSKWGLLFDEGGVGLSMCALRLLHRSFRMSISTLSRHSGHYGLCAYFFLDSAKAQNQSCFTTGGLPPISSSWRQTPWDSPPHRKRLFHYCMFSRCQGKYMSMELYPSNGCCTVTCLHSCYLAMGLLIAIYKDSVRTSQETH
jgi:hypothetical protein